MDALIRKTAEHVKELMAGEASGHDWWHVYRVWQMARRLGSESGAEMLPVELGALLHDIADWKFNGGDKDAGPRAAREWLEAIDADPGVVDHVGEIIATVSFEGAGVPDRPATLEAEIVQDADRLDAIGAIGIGRTFAFGGARGREMYNPDVDPELHDSFDSYKKSASPTINHFYEKLFLLRDRMKTPAARKIADERHQYLEGFVARFLDEWNGAL
jgi:uncharacterized protein